MTGLLDRLLDAFRPPSGTPKAAADSSALMFGGMDWTQYLMRAQSSVSVTEGDARSVATVMACTSLIGGALASMPLHFYRQKGDQREKYTPEEWWMFNERWAPAWSAAAAWQYLSDSRLFHGDGLALITRVSPFDPRIAMIEPWHPLLVDIRRIDGRLKYRFTPPPDQPDRVPVVVDQDDVLHFPGAGFNGVRSISQLQFALRTAAGIAVAADEQSAAWYADGARPDFAIEAPGNLDPEAARLLRQSWLERHSGATSNKAPVVLSGGVKLHQLTLSAEDSQLIASRKFQVEEICRAFGVPPHMVGHTEKTTSWGSGVEEMSIGFIKYTMRRHLNAFEQEINYKLFKTARNFVEFQTAGLERGDIKTRSEAYRIGLGRAGEPGWLSPNEVRALENMKPFDGGDDIATGQTPAAPEPKEPEPKDPNEDGTT